jgi:tRNA (cmo5U34)-methyltransferase
MRLVPSLRKTRFASAATIRDMSGIDNTTAHPAGEYDKNIRKSIPFYDQFHEAAINVVAAYIHDPMIWIDVGCGTGTFVERAYDSFPTVEFIMTDPSAAMLDLAKAKLTGKNRATVLAPVTAEKLDIPKRADVVSAIQSLHYLDANGRKQAVQNCFHLLRKGGIFVTFENIKPLTDKGTEIGTSNWQGFEVRAGKSIDEARKHVQRSGVEFFPITVEEHLRLLREANFSVVELLWYSYVQAGFYCIK